MSDNYAVAGKGLKLMFVGTIVGIAAVVLTIIPFLGVLGGGIAAIAGGLISLYGLYVAMGAQENYKNAMYMQLASIVVSILGSIFVEGLLGGIVDILSAVVSFLITYFVCTASHILLSDKGDSVQADRATLIIKLYAVCTLVNVVGILVSWIPVLNMIAGVIVALTSIVALVASVLLIIFYYKASQSLLA